MKKIILSLAKKRTPFFRVSSFAYIVYRFILIQIYLLVQFMNNKSRTQFRFKPSGLRRHNLTAVGNIHNLFHRYRIQRESHLHLTVVNTAFQFFKSAQSTDEVDSLVRTQILDTEQFV